jgi:peptide/nickel transport system permease protein
MILRLALRRCLPVVPRLFAVVTLVFFFLHLVPGDPVDVMLGETAQAADKEALRRTLGLDRPVLERYGRYLAGLARGDLGESLGLQAPVWRLVASRYPATLELAAAAVLIAMSVALPLGVLAAAHPGSLLDRAAMAVALLGTSIPNFALGPVLIVAFAISLGWAPVSGRGGAAHLVLPALTLGVGMAGILSRITRASVLETLGEDYIRTARAKGMGSWRVLVAHALRNALLPVVTVVSLQLGTLLAGTIITETIFAWPGLGRLTVDAIAARDYPVVQGCILAIGVGYVVVNTAADLLYALADPRIRHGGTHEA